MFNYNRKKYHFLRPVKKENDSILERPEFSYPETRSDRKEGRADGRLVNYLRKPRSEIGATALISAAIAAGLTVLAFWLMVKTLGNPPLYVSAIAGSAVLFSLYAGGCAVLSVLEKDRDHLFALLGLSIGGMVLITWIITMLVGVTA